MLYGAIPNIKLPVSRLILGTMAFAPEPAERLEHWYSLLDSFTAAGGNTLDTAHVYGGGRSERTIGLWLQRRNRRDDIVVVGKGAHPSSAAPRRVTPEAISADLRESLERLGVSYIDLYLLHRDDPAVPVGPIVECLNEHAAAGRIRAFGGSNWTTERIEQANDYATAHGLQGFSAGSPNLSLAVPKEPMWPGCVSVDHAAYRWYWERQFPLLSWSSQARGFFSGRFSPDARDNADMVRVYYDEGNWERLKRAQEMAAEKGCTTTQIALAWLIRQPLAAYALIGPLATDELQDSLGALKVELSADEYHWLRAEERELSQS